MQEIAYKYVEKVSSILYKKKAEKEALFKGRGSLLLFDYEQFSITRDIMYKQHIRESVTVINKKMADSTAIFSTFSFAEGVTGYAWLFDVLENAGLLVPGDINLNDIDQQLVAAALSFIEINAIDFLNGAFGIIHYFLSKKQTPLVQQYVSLLIAKMVQNKRDIYDTFRNSIIYPEHNKIINLGFCFGLSGQLMILLKAYRLGYNKLHSELKSFILRGSQFILNHKMDIDYADGYFSFFPETVKQDSKFMQGSEQLAWFNGDLNHALLFYEIAEVLGNTQYYNLAECIALQTIQRKTFKETLVKDSSLFDGSAGIARMYKKLSRYNNSGQYVQAYYYWIEQTIIFLQDELEKNYYEGREHNILNGLTGVALTLLSHASDKPSQWQSLLLL